MERLLGQHSRSEMVKDLAHRHHTDNLCTDLQGSLATLIQLLAIMLLTEDFLPQPLDLTDFHNIHRLLVHLQRLCLDNPLPLYLRDSQLRLS